MAGSLFGLGVTHPETNKQSPCDVYAAGNTPCVAAHSTVRSLYAKYTGAVYQVKSASDHATQNIGLLSDGSANAATQDAFCTNTTCIISKSMINRTTTSPSPPAEITKGLAPMVPILDADGG
jgi:hypothetical protein